MQSRTHHNVRHTHLFQRNLFILPVSVINICLQHANSMSTLAPINNYHSFHSDSQESIINAKTIITTTESIPLLQEAQLPQRYRATPRTHFTRDRQMDGQKAVARMRYAVCIVHKKGLRPKKPTENIGGNDHIL